MTTSHCEELQLTGGRDRQHAHEGDEIVGVMRGQSEAGQVVHSTVLGGAYAAVLSHGIPMVSRRTVYFVAAEATARVVTCLVQSPADLTVRTLIDVLTRSAIAPEPISVRTLARVATRSIVTNTDTEIVVFEFHALVHVRAGPIVSVQSESWFTTASVTAPNVQAHLLTESWDSLAFVDILASAATADILETLIAQAFVRAHGVLAAATLSADNVTVNAALVYVDAVVVGTVYVSRRTETLVAALPILAGLPFGAFVGALATLVHVNAILSGYRIQSVTRTADHFRHASIRS